MQQIILFVLNKSLAIILPSQKLTFSKLATCITNIIMVIEKFQIVIS